MRPGVGIGTTMLLHCDLVYAGDNAAFSMPFVNLGLCPSRRIQPAAAAMLGCHRAAEGLLLGEPFAEAALKWAWSIACCHPPNATAWRKPRPSWQPSPCLR